MVARSLFPCLFIEEVIKYRQDYIRDVPLTLREMYPEDISPQLMKYVADYKVNLVSPSLMSDEELDHKAK